MTKDTLITLGITGAVLGIGAGIYCTRTRPIEYRDARYIAQNNNNPKEHTFEVATMKSGHFGVGKWHWIGNVSVKVEDGAFNYLLSRKDTNGVDAVLNRYFHLRGRESPFGVVVITNVQPSAKQKAFTRFY